MNFGSFRWPFGLFSGSAHPGLSRGSCTKPCTKRRKRDRIIHDMIKLQFAVYRSIAPMMNQDITIKWANRASHHDEAHWRKSIDSTPFINRVWMIWHHIDTKLVQKRLYKKAESYPLTGMALCFLVQLCISIHSMEKVLSPSVKFPHKLTQAAYRWYNLQ